ADLRHNGRLQLVTGRVEGITAHPGNLQARVRTPHGERLLEADRVVLCAGLNADVTTTPDALAQQLLASGRARPDALRLGFAAAAGGRLLDTRDRPHDGLRILGPPLRGTLWETTAARECRDQAEHIARELAHFYRTAPPL